MFFRRWWERVYPWFETIGLTRQESYFVLLLALLTLAGASVRALRPGRVLPEPVTADSSDTKVWRQRSDSLRQLLVSGAGRDSIAGFVARMQDTPVRVVNINEANAQELNGLPGVGPKIAERMIAYRNQRGSFRTVEELQNVKGVGKKLFEKIRPFVDIK